MRPYTFVNRKCNEGFKGVTMMLNDIPMGSIISPEGSSTFACRTFFPSKRSKNEKLPIGEWAELTASEAKQALIDDAEKFFSDVL